MIEALSVFERVVRETGDAGQYTVVEPFGVHPFDERNIHSDISSVSINLFDDGHYAQATFEAFKYLDNQVKLISGLEETGFSLMMQAFNEGAPKILLTDLVSMSEKDEQKGFRYVFAGAMSGVRNPRAHDNKTDSIDVSLDHLSLERNPIMMDHIQRR